MHAFFSATYKRVFFKSILRAEYIRCASKYIHVWLHVHRPLPRLMPRSLHSSLLRMQPRSSQKPQLIKGPWLPMASAEAQTFCATTDDSGDGANGGARNRQAEPASTSLAPPVDGTAPCLSARLVSAPRATETHTTVPG
jgi:hypothetical protein